jgi:subtilisin family serine protease
MMSGTSFSSAYVAGTVALMLERRANLTPDGVRQALMASAHHLDAKAPNEFGAGLVDAYQAVVSVAPVAMDAAVSPTPVAIRP